MPSKKEAKVSTKPKSPAEAIMDRDHMRSIELSAAEALAQLIVKIETCYRAILAIDAEILVISGPPRRIGAMDRMRELRNRRSKIAIEMAGLDRDKSRLAKVVASAAMLSKNAKTLAEDRVRSSQGLLASSQDRHIEAKKKHAVVLQDAGDYRARNPKASVLRVAQYLGQKHFRDKEDPTESARAILRAHRESW